MLSGCLRHQIGFSSSRFLSDNTPVPHGCDWCMHVTYPKDYEYLYQAIKDLKGKERFELIRLTMKLHGMTYFGPCVGCACMDGCDDN